MKAERSAPQTASRPAQPLGRQGGLCERSERSGPELGTRSDGRSRRAYGLGGSTPAGTIAVEASMKLHQTQAWPPRAFTHRPEVSPRGAAGHRVLIGRESRRCASTVPRAKRNRETKALLPNPLSNREGKAGCGTVPRRHGPRNRHEFILDDPCRRFQRSHPPRVGRSNQNHPTRSASPLLSTTFSSVTDRPARRLR